MRCLSIRQPWASLIESGRKSVELRTRPECEADRPPRPVNHDNILESEWDELKKASRTVWKMLTSR